MGAWAICCIRRSYRKANRSVVTYFTGLIHRAHADLVGLRPPPKAHKLGRASDGVKVVDDVIEPVRLLYLAQTEGGADLHAHVEDDAGAAEAAEGGEEEVWVMISGASHLGSVCLEQTHGLDVGREHAVVDARAVGSCGEHTGEGLL